MFSYRLCRESDKDCWITLNRMFMEEEIQDHDLWNDTNKVSDEQFSNTFFEALQAKDFISLIIFEENHTPVGFANLMTIYSVWTHGKALILDDLYLLPDARGKGYGKRAMELIEQFASMRGCKRLQFQSEETNPNAMNFYIALGYCPADMKFYVKYL